MTCNKYIYIYIHILRVRDERGRSRLCRPASEGRVRLSPRAWEQIGPQRYGHIYIYIYIYVYIYIYIEREREMDIVVVFEDLRLRCRGLCYGVSRLSVFKASGSSFRG